MTGGFALGGGTYIPTITDFEIMMTCFTIAVGLTIALIVAWKWKK